MNKDLEYFRNKVIQSMGIPKSYFMTKPTNRTSALLQNSFFVKTCNLWKDLITLKKDSNTGEKNA